MMEQDNAPQPVLHGFGTLGFHKSKDASVNLMELTQTGKFHKMAANKIIWHPNGNLLLSGGDDSVMNVLGYNSQQNALEVVWTTKNDDEHCYSSMRFFGDGINVISGCNSSGTVLVTNTEMPNSKNKYRCHDGGCNDVVVLSNDVFMTCGIDNTIRQYDRRITASCNCEIKGANRHLEVAMEVEPCPVSLEVSPSLNHLVVGSANGLVDFYDRRMLATGTNGVIGSLTVPRTGGGTFEFVLKYSSCGQLLLNGPNNSLFLYEVSNPGHNMSHALEYHGHETDRHIKIDADFYGEEHIISGSTCGSVFVWEKQSHDIMKFINTKSDIAASVCPHPTYPLIAACDPSGEGEIKLLSPVEDEGF